MGQEIGLRVAETFPESDGPIGTRPVAVGAYGVVTALLAGPADRFDRLTSGPQLVDERDYQRVRGVQFPE